MLGLTEEQVRSTTPVTAVVPVHLVCFWDVTGNTLGLDMDMNVLDFSFG